MAAIDRGAALAPAADSTLALLAWLVGPQGDDPLARPRRAREADRAHRLEALRTDGPAGELTARYVRLGPAERRRLKAEAWTRLPSLRPRQLRRPSPLAVELLHRTAIEVLRERVAASA